MNNSEIREVSDEYLSELDPSSYPYQSEFQGDNYNSEFSEDSNDSDLYIEGKNKMMQIGLFEETKKRLHTKFEYDALGIPLNSLFICSAKN